MLFKQLANLDIMNMKKNTKKGFTLVEVIVVALLMVVFALGAFSLFNMYSQASRRTAANLKMQRQSEALMDEISRRTREANRIWALDANRDPFDLVSGNPSDNVNGIIMIDDDNTLMSAFWFPAGNGNVQWWRCEQPGGSGCQPPGINDWIDFSIDGTPLELALLNDAGTAVNNIFELAADRQQISVNITLQTPIPRGNVSLTAERGTFQCRF